MKDRCPVVNNSCVCSRVLPVCQHRPMRHLLGIPTSAINQAMPAAAVETSYVRTPPKKTATSGVNHNAEFSLEQQTTYYSYIGARFLRTFLFFIASPHRSNTQNTAMRLTRHGWQDRSFQVYWSLCRQTWTVPGPRQGYGYNPFGPRVKRPKQVTVDCDVLQACTR